MADYGLHITAHCRVYDYGRDEQHIAYGIWYMAHSPLAVVFVCVCVDVCCLVGCALM